MVALEVLSRAALRSLAAVALGVFPQLAAAERSWFDAPLSGATTPSTMPVPKSSPSRDIFFASP